MKAMKFHGWNSIIHYLKWLVLFIALSLSLLITANGCTNSSTEAESLFPTQSEPATYHFQGLLNGYLVMEDNYVRVKEFLIIWPYGYSLKESSETIDIIDHNGDIVAQVGDRVALGGGVYEYMDLSYFTTDIPPEDQGPFWFAYTVEVIN